MSPRPQTMTSPRQYAYAISEFSVQAEDTDNVKPMFADGDVGLGGTQLRQRVNENFELDDEAVTVSPVGLATRDRQCQHPWGPQGGDLGSGYHPDLGRDIRRR